MRHFLSLTLVVLSLSAHGQTAKSKPPLVVGPVALNCINKPCEAASITANARGSGVNGPLTAQTGAIINIQKDNWWTGGKVGEVDGLGHTGPPERATLGFFGNSGECAEPGAWISLRYRVCLVDCRSGAERSYLRN
jgi:hypothetical protein